MGSKRLSCHRNYITCLCPHRMRHVRSDDCYGRTASFACVPVVQSTQICGATRRLTRRRSRQAAECRARRPSRLVPARDGRRHAACRCSTSNPSCIAASGAPPVHSRVNAACSLTSNPLGGHHPCGRPLPPPNHETRSTSWRVVRWTGMARGGRLTAASSKYGLGPTDSVRAPFRGGNIADLARTHARNVPVQPY
jgi:hypothetical protein